MRMPSMKAQMAIGSARNPQLKSVPRSWKRALPV